MDVADDGLLHPSRELRELRAEVARERGVHEDRPHGRELVQGFAPSWCHASQKMILRTGVEGTETAKRVVPRATYKRRIQSKPVPSSSEPEPYPGSLLGPNTGVPPRLWGEWVVMCRFEITIEMMSSKLRSVEEPVELAGEEGSSSVR